MEKTFDWKRLKESKTVEFNLSFGKEVIISLAYSENASKLQECDLRIK